MSTEQTIVITGASSGIGAAAARALHRQGAQVVVVGRDPAKTAEVARSVGTEPLVADFARLDDVRRLAGVLLDRCPRIDVLANNAGGQWKGEHRTGDGFSMTFQVNHLAPYLLTRLLEQRLADSSARVITTSSGAHTMGRLSAGQPDQHAGLRAYGDSKLANILMTVEIGRRWGDRHMRAAAFNPGFAATSFGRNSPVMRWLGASPVSRLMRSPEQGAGTLVWLATTGQWRSGGYFMDEKEAKPSESARDPELARQFWDKSAELLGLEP